MFTFMFWLRNFCQQIVGNTPKKNNVRNKVLLRHTHVKTSRLHVCHAKFMANPSESMMTFPYLPGMLGRCSAFANYALTYHILLNSCKITILHTSFMRNSWVIICFFTPTNHSSFNTHWQPPKPRKPGPGLLKCLFHSQWITMRYKAPIRSNHWETIQKQHAWQQIPSKFSQVQQTNPKLFAPTSWGALADLSILKNGVFLTTKIHKDQCGFSWQRCRMVPIGRDFWLKYIIFLSGIRWKPGPNDSTLINTHTYTLVTCSLLSKCGKLSKAKAQEVVKS